MKLLIYVIHSIQRDHPKYFTLNYITNDMTFKFGWLIRGILGNRTAWSMWSFCALQTNKK